MDIARRYLQMGYTRAQRYASHKGGNKNRPFDEPDPEIAGLRRYSMGSDARPPRTSSN